MDFLRRLAPVRDTDPSRAQALLPSLFSNQQPLQEAPVRAATEQRFDDGTISGLLARDEPPGTGNSAAPMGPAVIDFESLHAAPNALAAKPAPGKKQRPVSPVRASDQPTDAPSISHVRTAPEAVPLAEPSPALHSLPSSPARAALNAMPMRQPSSAPYAQPVDTGPLSQSSLAQRTVPSHEDSAVVHVTIGRIDVVTSTAAPSAPSRSAAPRQPSVTLAEYLRGQHRSHEGRP
jgi:hypothetical protein